MVMLPMVFFLLPNMGFAQNSGIAELTARNNELQEQVRALNGRVENLSFQLLQLQERLRKMQEDNEFRFQQLEDKRSNAGSEKKSKTVKIIPDKKPEGKKEEIPSLGKSKPSEPRQVAKSSGGKKPQRVKRRILGHPPRSLGTLVFDEDGNVVDSALGKPLDLSRRVETVPDRPVEPANPAKNGTKQPFPSAPELIAKGRRLYKAGDYQLAAKSFQLFTQTYPQNKNIPEAEFLLGESLFANGDFHGAASVYLNAHNAHPRDKRGAETLLKLGLSMAGLNEREVACATFAEVLKQYPNAGANIANRVVIEQKNSKCG